MSITSISTTNEAFLIDQQDDKNLERIPVTVAQGNPTPEQWGNALLKALGFTEEDVQAYNAYYKEQTGKDFDLRKEVADIFRECDQTKGCEKTRPNIPGVKSYPAVAKVNRDYVNHLRGFLLEKRGKQTPEPQAEQNAQTTNDTGIGQTAKGEELQQRGNEKREALNRMLQEKFKNISKTDPTVLGATAIATTRTVPALPAAAPWIGGAILAAPAIYTIKEILLNAAEKGVIQSPPMPITMDDAKPVDTATPTTPDTTIPTDEELPKGDLTKTGPATTATPAAPVTPTTPPISPTGGQGKGPEKIPPIVGPIVGATTATIGTLSGSLSTTGPERTQPSLSPDPNRVPRGKPAEEIDRGKIRENESAKLLSQAGYDVEQNPTITADDVKNNPSLKQVKDPDYRIEGKIFDCYAPDASRALNLQVRIAEKVTKGQTTRLILNLEDSKVSIDELREVLTDTPIKNLEEIIIIKDGKITHFFPFE